MSFFNRAVFVSDVLKIDDRSDNLYANPQRINVDWIHSLFGDIFYDVFGFKESNIVYGDEGGFESIRWSVYNRIGLPFCGDSWALLYEGKEFYDVVEDVLKPYFKNVDVAFGFEIPPYLLKFFNNNGIDYIDFTIHPIRFLPDYVFGVRTNIESIQRKLNDSKISEQVFYDFARISKSRTVRVARSLNIVPNSAIFMGQIEVDSSLIQDGKVVTLEDVENSLIELTMAYPKVYYKAHPHNKSLKALKASVSKIRNCEWIDINAYDAFGINNFSLISSMSSGTLLEAKYFGCNTRAFLNNKNHFNYLNENSNEIYYPICKDVLSKDYWEWLVNSRECVLSPCLDAFEGAVKFSLNMKWGR